MKTLVSALLVLAMVSPLCAGTLLQEDFNGTAGTTVSGWNGWTGNNEIVITDTVIDQGNSAYWYAPVETIYGVSTHTFSHTPTSGEQYVLSASFYASDTTGALSRLQIWKPGDGDGAYPLMALNAGLFDFSTAAGSFASISVDPAVNPVMDGKLVIQNGRVDGYYRVNGAPAWSYAGFYLGEDISLSNYTQVSMVSKGQWHAGGMDTILLTAEPIPEPTALALLLTGMVGLLAYAWRKRK